MKVEFIKEKGKKTSEKGFDSGLTKLILIHSTLFLLKKNLKEKLFN